MRKFPPMHVITMILPRLELHGQVQGFKRIIMFMTVIAIQPTTIKNLKHFSPPWIDYSIRIDQFHGTTIILLLRMGNYILIFHTVFNWKTGIVVSAPNVTKY